ncbi:MAG: tetratricopeptide repeat protein [Candidatus Obscuribacterales bacterium]
MTWEESINRGTLALARADYATAECAFKSALATAQAEFSPHDERLQQTFSFLGQTYYKLGDHEKAKNFLELSTNADRAEENDTLRLAVDHLSLAQMDSANGESSNARDHFHKAIAVLQTAKTTNFEYSFDATNELEQLFNAASRRENAQTNESFRDLLLKAQENHRARPRTQQYFGTEPNSIVDAWQNLMESGLTLALNKDSESIITAFQNLNSALRIATAMFPADHQYIADSLSSLALVAAQMGLEEEADDLFREASRIFEKNKVDPLKVAMFKMNMANFYTDQFDHQAAIQALSEAAELVEQLDAQENENSSFVDGMSSSFFVLMQKADIHRNARDMIRRGIELEENDRLEQADYYYRNSIELLQKIFGDMHLEVSSILRFRAHILKKLGDKKEAAIADARAQEIEDEIGKRAEQLEQLKANLPAIRYSHF